MTEQLILDRKEIMEEKGEQCAEFPKNIFFILDRYGEEYNYILANGGGDSAVYYYNYPEDTFKKVFDSIGEWFEAHVADMKSFRDQGIDQSSFDYSLVDVAVYKISKPRQGEPFPACFHCSGIIPAEVNIITKRRTFDEDAQSD